MKNLSKIGSVLTAAFFFMGSYAMAQDNQARRDTTTRTKSIDEVVLVGYGTQRKETTAGSTANLSQKVINVMKDQPAVSLTSSLQGTLPGLTIISRPGDVGSNPSGVNIRGRGNLGASSPMYVIDGVTSTAADFYRINPRDIENMTVLKDASASIYGNRAAFGVILVTTKKGSGRLSVSYDANYGLQNPTNLPDYVGSVDYMTLRNEAARNAGIAQVFRQSQIDQAASGAYPDLYPNNNWYNLVYRKYAALIDHNLNISGGSGNTRFFVSAGYLNQESLLPTKDMDRFSFRTNVSSKLSDKIEVRTNINFIKENVTNDGADISTVSLARMTPTMVARHSDGTWGTINAGAADATLGADNPMRINREGGRGGSELYKFTGVFGGTYKPLPGLSFDGQISYKLDMGRSNNFNATIPELTNFLTKRPIGGTATNVINQFNETWNRATNLLSTLTGNYEKRFDKHYVKLMVGTSFENQDGRYLNASRRNYITNNLMSIDSGPNTETTRFNSGGLTGENRKIFSYFSRLNYTFMDRYILEGIFRADASSQYDPNNRWGYFPGVMAAWAIDKENFMQNTPFNTLKLRASYGLQGNAGNVGNFNYLELIRQGNGAILGQAQTAAVYPGQYINRNFGWEKVLAKNLGLDASFLDKRLSLVIDAYDRETYDILMSFQLPMELGVGPNDANLPTRNIAKVRNRGFEGQIGWQDAKGDFSYFVNLNASRNWNKILDLAGQSMILTDPWVQMVGGSIGDFYGLVADGLLTEADITANVPRWANSRAGDIKYVDVNGDGRITLDGDRAVIGNDVPKWTYGLNAGFTYKNFDFNVIAQGVQGTKINLNNEAAWAFFNGGNVKRYVLENRWTAENPDPGALYPRILPSAQNNQNQQFSSFWLFNSDYIRFRNISLGYTLPQSLTDNLKINRFRIFFSLQNYFTIRFDKRMGDFDPELASGRASYPTQKTMTFGINATF